MKRVTIRAVCLSCLVAAPLWAQDNPKPDVDVRVMVLMNGFYTSGKTNNVDLPQVAVPPSAGDSSTGGLGATIRQSRVTAHALLAGFAGGDFNAELDVDFWGGQQPSNGGRTFPLLRIRRAWAQMTWDRLNLLVGQEAPPIVELNPSSLASIGLSSLSASGNLWLWIPQIRLTYDVLGSSPRGRLGLEATVLAPTGYEAQGPFLTQPDEAEASKRPYLQGRILYRWGEGDNAGQVSFGGHLGWFVTGGDSLLDSEAAAFLIQAPIGRMVEIRGEAFVGQAVAGLGGGAIGQNFGVNGVPVRTKGGWGQLLVRPSPAWEIGASYGIDNPDDDDLDTATQRLKNETVVGEIQWRPSPLVLGLEYRHIATTYGSGTQTADHINLGLGAEF